MSESDLEKKYEATEKRLLDLKKQGRFLRSKDYLSFVILTSYVFFISVWIKSFFSNFENNWSYALYQITSVKSDIDLSKILFFFGFHDIQALVLIYAIVLSIIIASFWVFGGIDFSFHSIKFNVERLSIFKNLSKIFSSQIFYELLKSFIKAILILSAIIFFVKTKSESIFHLFRLDLKDSISTIKFIVLSFIYFILLASGLIASFDMIYQWIQFKNESRMTLQEIKDEQKESETKPEVKNKIRLRQILLLKQQLSSVIPAATVVIVNPIHYAVVLRYQDNKDRAPRVVAKGQNEIVDHIKLLANKHGVPVFSFPTLARSLYFTTKVGDEIKSELYTAVALVLSYLYQLKNYQAGKSAMPKPIEDLPIPPEFSHY